MKQNETHKNYMDKLKKELTTAIVKIMDDSISSIGTCVYQGNIDYIMAICDIIFSKIEVENHSTIMNGIMDAEQTYYFLKKLNESKIEDSVLRCFAKAHIYRNDGEINLVFREVNYYGKERIEKTQPVWSELLFKVFDSDKLNIEFNK